MSVVRLGAVEYLNARPLVFGLDRDPAFDLRFDIPSRCADLLHEGGIDLGLIPSIEYLRGDGARAGYRIVPDLAIASRGPVASVAIFTKRPMADITLARARHELADIGGAHEGALPPGVPHRPGADAPGAGSRRDAALGGRGADDRRPRAVGVVRRRSSGVRREDRSRRGVDAVDRAAVRLCLLGGAAWGRRVGKDGLACGGRATRGVAQAEAVARAYFTDADQQALGARYLRDNIRYATRRRRARGPGAVLSLRCTSSDLVPRRRRCGSSDEP